MRFVRTNCYANIHDEKWRPMRFLCRLTSVLENRILSLDRDTWRARYVSERMDLSLLSTYVYNSALGLLISGGIWLLGGRVLAWSRDRRQTCLFVLVRGCVLSIRSRWSGGLVIVSGWLLADVVGIMCRGLAGTRRRCCSWYGACCRRASSLEPGGCMSWPRQMG